LEDYTRLGDLQQNILKHIFTCKSKAENTTHIAKSLGRTQPTVRKSVESLIKEGYMIGKQKHKRSEKVLELTYKGAASVIALGATLEEVEAWARSTDSKNLDVIQHIKDQFPVSYAADLWFQKAMQYGLKNNYFENNKAKNLTPLERTKMLQNFQMEYLNSLGPVANIDSMADLTKPTTLKEIMDRFGLDKYYLKGYLNYQKELIDMVIKQLDAMD
jgi:DNA-binding MarR family transcriptional regulator